MLGAGDTAGADHEFAGGHGLCPASHAICDGIHRQLHLSEIA